MQATKSKRKKKQKPALTKPPVQTQGRCAPLLRSGAARPDGRFASLIWPARGAGGGAPSHVTAKSEKESPMLKVYAVMIDVLRQLRPVLVQIERHDRDLGNQLRRASASVALNIAEASGSSHGTKTTRFRTALGSARETGACLDVAMALGYVGDVEAVLLSRLDEVRAMLGALVR